MLGSVVAAVRVIDGTESDIERDTGFPSFQNVFSVRAANRAGISPDLASALIEFGRAEALDERELMRVNISAMALTIEGMMRQHDDDEALREDLFSMPEFGTWAVLVAAHDPHLVRSLNARLKDPRLAQVLAIASKLDPDALAP
jgi:hypothetical protein